MARDPFADPEPLIRRVYSYVAYRVADPFAAEDITSETFERALRYRGSFDPRRGDAAAWLIGIARRCIADHALSVAEPPPSTEAVVDDHASDSIRTVELMAAVSTLSERDREIIALRFGADMTTREIARVLELRQNTVEVALHRALARLRGFLDANDPLVNAVERTAPRAPGPTSR